MHGLLPFAEMAAVQGDGNEIRDDNETVQPVESHRALLEKWAP
jgi:hypothetical protein